jgi:UDP-N-acetylmuramyl pentapeptide phosphotransferase/UDP-N-acetylglucosamine-1-phosphate transferase
VINAFNLIDGVDGLAGSLGLMSMVLFGGYFYAVNMTAYALLAFSMAGSLLAFLIFNFNPARIFMGDSGSLLIGLINAILVLKFISVADSAAVAFPLQSVVAIGFSVLMVPLADTLRVFSIRIFQGRSPFCPDRNHIHHLLLDRGMGQKQVTLTCLMLNALFIAIAYLGRGLGSNYIMLLISVVACVFLGLLVYLKKPVRKVFVVQPLRQRSKSLSSTSTKVVSMAPEVAIVEN